MPSSHHLIPHVDAWTVQAVAASRWLTRLYRALGDERQAAAAIQAGAPAQERLERLRFQGRVALVEARFAQEHPEETEAEQMAWTILVEALGGIFAFHSISDATEAGKPVPGVRGARTTTYSAFRKAIRGFHTAFPEEMAVQGITAAVTRAATTCAEAVLSGIGETDPDARDRIRSGMEDCIREALDKAVSA